MPAQGEGRRKMSIPRRMHVPRRMGPPPRRMNAAGMVGSMFPHTVTLYNVEVETDPDTTKSTVINHITILRGVFLEASKSVNVRESGLESADAVNLYIPFGVEALDGSTGKAKKYLPPVEFWRTEDKSGFWTLAISAKGSNLHGYTFFIKGVALPPETEPQGNPVRPEMVVDVVESMYDHVYNITKVDEKDFGSQDMQHWEVGGV